VGSRSGRLFMKVWLRIFLGGVLAVVILPVRPVAIAVPSVPSGTPVGCGYEHFVFHQDLVLVSRVEGGIFAGLYKATNGEWKWLPAPTFSWMKAAPGEIIYLYSQAGPGHPNRVYRSMDGGETWELAGEDIPSAGVGTFIFPSPMPDMVFLGVGDLPFTPGVRGIYKSTDGGATWQKVLEGGNGVWVAFSADFASDGTAFAALDEYRISLGVWKTEDWGETWVKKSDGLAYGLTGGGHKWVMVSPQYPQDQTAFTTDATGFYKTIDGGESWFRLPDRAGDITLSPNYAVDQTILATSPVSLRLSQDGGESWQLLGEYDSVTAGIRIPGPFGASSAPPAPPPGPHRVYLPLVGHRMGDRTLEFWLVRLWPAGNSVECYLYRSYDFGVTWEELFVFEAAHWLYLPLVSQMPRREQEGSARWWSYTR
jgi:photosystem II stability/assembly factor-like uncharacterized protein